MPDLLEIGAVINLSQALPGMSTLASAVENGCARMNASFTQLRSGLVLTAGAVNELESAGMNVAKMTPAVETIPPAVNRVRASSMEARHALGGMGEELGVRMPRFVRNLLTDIGPLSSLLAAAFAPIAIIGLIEWLSKIPAAIRNMTDSIMGFGEEQKKAFKDAVAASDEALVHNKNLNDAQRMMQDTVRRLGDLARETFTERFVKGLKQAQEETSAMWGPLTGIVTVFRGWKDANEQVRESQAKLEAQLREQETTVMRLMAERHEADLRNELEAYKVGEIGATATQKVQQQLKALGVEEEAELTRLSAEGKLTFELRQQLDALYALKAEGIRRTAALEAAHQSYGVTEARIAADKALTDAQIAGATERAAREVQIDKDKWGEQIATDRTMENLRHLNAVGALEARKAATLKLQSETGQSQARELVTIDGELAKEEQAHTNNKKKLEDDFTLHVQAQERHITAMMQAEFAQRMKDAGRDTAEHEAGVRTIMALDQERIRISEMTGNRELAEDTRTNEQKLRGHRESLRQWADAQKEAIDAWYLNQRDVLLTEIEDAREFYGEDDINYQEAVARKEALDAQWVGKRAQVDARLEKNTEQVMARMTQHVSVGLAQAAMGYQKFGQAAIQVEQQILAAMIENFVKQEALRLMARIAQKDDAEQSILMDAGQAAAGAFKAVMNSGLPWPIAAPLAPIAAAAAFAGTMAYGGSFDEGGMATRTGMAMIHQSEIVMPPTVSSAFRSMASGGGMGRSVAQHNEFNLHHTGPDAQRVLERQLVPRLRQALRRGAL